VIMVFWRSAISNFSHNTQSQAFRFELHVIGRSSRRIRSSSIRGQPRHVLSWIENISIVAGFNLE